MPSRRLRSSSDSDSDAPEAVSLDQSRRSIRQQNAGIRKAEALAREKTKLKNRERDRRLKERAANNKKGNGGEGSSNRRKVQIVVEDDAEEEEDEEAGNGPMDEVEARMLRAMEDAENEGGDESESEGDDVSSSQDEDEELATSDDHDMEDESMEEGMFEADEEVDSELDDEAMDSEEDQHSGSLRVQSSKQDRVGKSSNYLPDEIFKAAFSQTTKPNTSRLQKDNPSKGNERQRKRKHTLSRPKDVIVGARAIRTLTSAARPVAPGGAVPPPKINKFLNRTLALKEQRRVPGKSWERRPANIGVLRRNGPAAHFVRNR